MNESLIDDDALKTQITAEMQQGFAVAALAHHGETYVWEDPAVANTFPINHLVSYEFLSYDTSNRMPANRPFFYFNACRVGLGYTSGWNAGQPGAYDDTMVYALVHRGVSGIIASAGLAYGCFESNVACNAEILGNQFWVEAAAYPDRSDPLGWALMRAKVKHPVNGNVTEKKTVQTFTYFGVPWTRLPGHASALASTSTKPPASGTTSVWSTPVQIAGGGLAPLALQATYVVTTHVDASTYAISNTTGGFNLIDVTGLSQTLEDNQVVLPRAGLEYILPLSATVTGLTFTPTQPVNLNNLDIPTLLSGVPIPGGPTGGYTTTLAGTYPVTANLEMRTLGTYQLARVYVTPAAYDAATDQATLYRSVDVQLQYDTPRTLVLSRFDTNKTQYVPGDTISVTARIVNAGEAAATVTATLQILDVQGVPISFTVAGGLLVPAGGSYDLDMAWTGRLEGEAYWVGQEYGPMSQNIAGGYRIFLPLVLK